MNLSSKGLGLQGKTEQWNVQISTVETKDSNLELLR